MKNYRFSDVEVTGVPFNISRELDSTEKTEESVCQELPLPSVSERQESCDKIQTSKDILLEKARRSPDTRTSTITKVYRSENNRSADISPEFYTQNLLINVDIWKVFKKCRKGGTNIVESVRKTGVNSYNARKTRYIESLKLKTASTTPVPKCERSILKPVNLNKRKLSKTPTKPCFSPCPNR